MNRVQKCPQCGRLGVEYDPNRNEYHCVYRDCHWAYRSRCKYPSCDRVTAYPDTALCSEHRTLHTFITGIKGAH